MIISLSAIGTTLIVMLITVMGSMLCVGLIWKIAMLLLHIAMTVVLAPFRGMWYLITSH